MVAPTEEEVDDAVDRWHDGAGKGMHLHEYLGWSWAEYKSWVKTNIPPDRPLKVWE